jgi:hypothetical protein
MRSKLLLLPLLSALCGCGFPFSPAGQPALAETVTAAVPIPQAMMGALQEDLDLDEAQAAAIIGNLAQETGNFTILRQVGGPSFGYSQWSGSRKRAFLSFAEENGGPHSFEANYGFLLHEIETDYAAMVERLRATDDVKAASRIFMREFLRPSPKHANLSGRVRYAELYLAAEFDGAGCVGGDHVDGDRIRPCPEPGPPEVVLAAAPPEPALGTAEAVRNETGGEGAVGAAPVIAEAAPGQERAAAGVRSAQAVRVETSPDQPVKKGALTVDAGDVTLTSGKPRLFTAGRDRRRFMSPTFGWRHIFARSRSELRRSLRRSMTGTRAPSARSAATPAGRAAGAGTRPPSGS